MDELDLKELKSVSILCVEDEKGIRESIVETLKYYFGSVYEARNGDEAYEVYKYNRPKIILSDIQMESCNGIEFVKKVRENDKDTVIFMLTAHSNEEYLIDLINLNINHFILKPLNLKKLEEILKKYLDKTSKLINLGNNLQLNLKKRELIYENDKIIVLRKREKDFLKLLFDKKNSILSYDEIEHELWIDKQMTTHALKSFIKEIRNKLPINIIKNVPLEGYTLAV